MDNINKYKNNGDDDVIVNELPIIDFSDNPTGCCPKFHPEPWDEKIFRFRDMLFAQTQTRSFLHMPLNIGKVMTQSQKLIDAVDGFDPNCYLILSKDISNWKTYHYFKVVKDIPGMEMTRLSGTYMTKVFDASFKEFPKLIRNFESYVESNGATMKELLVFYTTCPKCAETYQHNYMVFFGRI
ncbi:MAG: hypothetical protein JEZ08_11765 [Clostridiales bacterium]|nr:hypothetical protein [Clostridiales bacterium]